MRRVQISTSVRHDRLLTAWSVADRLINRMPSSRQTMNTILDEDYQPRVPSTMRNKWVKLFLLVATLGGSIALAYDSSLQMPSADTWGLGVTQALSACSTSCSTPATTSLAMLMLAVLSACMLYYVIVGVVYTVDAAYRLRDWLTTRK